jgi:hypothetical protein
MLRHHRGGFAFTPTTDTVCQALYLHVDRHLFSSPRGCSTGQTDYPSTPPCIRNIIRPTSLRPLPLLCCVAAFAL